VSTPRRSRTFPGRFGSNDWSAVAAPRIRHAGHRRRVTLLFGLSGDGFASATQLRALATLTLNETNLSPSRRVVRDRQAFHSLEMAISELLDSRHEVDSASSEPNLALDALMRDFDAAQAPRLPQFFLVLPRDAHFVNRERELDDIAAATENAAVPQVIFLVGMGGAGKSAAAIEFAHAYRRRFRDGLVWVELGTTKTEDVLYALTQAFDRGRGC
jgi:hypothetical protein